MEFAIVTCQTRRNTPVGLRVLAEILRLSGGFALSFRHK
jgi:hypothetical protein